MADNERFFGVPEENIAAAQRRTVGQRNPPSTSVPTQRDVATLPAVELKAVLTAWMEHSATEIIPSRAQIALVRDILLKRQDAAEIVSIVCMCGHYIEGA